MKKKNSVPSAFEDAFNNLGYSNSMLSEEVTDMDKQDSFVDVEPTKETDDKPSEEPLEDDKGTEGGADDSKIPQEVLDRMNGKETTEQPNNIDNNNEPEPIDDEPSKDDYTEAEQIGALFDAIVDKFGWSTDDIDEETRPVDVEGLVNYMTDVVAENSVPEYADERIQQLDEYVKNGGKFEDFYTAQQQQLNYESLNLEDESNQRTVIRELLRTSGYTDEQIENKLDRYEAADMLEEEAEDALSRLKVIKQEETERLRMEQAAQLRQQEENNKKFFTDMNNQIASLTDIRGIAIPKEDRQALLNYIFKTDSDGLSQYQKDFNKNLTKNLIESAYFTMKADAFVKEAKKTGETTAAQKLRQMLRHTSKNHSSYNADEDKQRPAWEIASKFL